MPRYTKPGDPRPRWQLRLATCVLLMFTGAAIVPLNLVPRRHDRIYDYGLYCEDFRYRGYGWPDSRMYKLPLEEPEKDWALPTVYAFADAGIDYDSLLLNVLAWLTLLAGVATLSEMVLRRREARDRNTE